MTPTELYEYLTSVDFRGPVLEYVDKNTRYTWTLNKVGVRSYKWSHLDSSFILSFFMCRNWLEYGEIIFTYQPLDENEVWE